jgi:diaminopimelate decarboxylase
MAFNYKNGVLYAESVNLSKLAQEVQTPFYCYSKQAFVDNLNKFKAALPNSTVCYAVKANANLAILKILAEAGAGADIVSGGELYAALKCGIPGSKIVYSGVGKTEKDISMAIQNDIRQINEESAEELDAVNQTAIRLCGGANVALRVNPDVDAGTHKKITTGKKENKFGILWKDALPLYCKARYMSGVRIKGIAVHIGSQILNLKRFETAFKKIAKMVETLEKEGVIIQNIDIGGGLGVVYNYKTDKPVSYKEYKKIIDRTLGGLKKHIILEPGRKIVANAGVLITKVLYNKKSDGNNFLIVDAGMNDFARPALYDAYHEILPLRDWKRPLKTVSVVGPVCESSDVFARGRKLPALERGECVAIMGAGAYGSSMSSTYNLRPLAAEVLAEGDSYRVIRPAQTCEQMLCGQLDFLRHNFLGTQRPSK